MSLTPAGLYVDFNIPLGLYNLLQDIIAHTQHDPNTPQVLVPPANRMWISQPRPGADQTVEVITVNFKLPMQISEVEWDTLRVNCHTELWYQDQSNNWRQVLDESRNPVTLDVSQSSAQAWYTAQFYCYPLVAKKVQWRISRVFDPLVGPVPYPVGIREGLLRRDIYNRSDGTRFIEDQQDTVGNAISSYIKDWDASKSFDNDPNTYWRCLGQPDPNAVVWLALDVRSADGSPQLIDALYIDPLYTGNILNLYYSNDDTVGVRKLSPVTAPATTDTYTQWQAGKGRWDTSTWGANSDYDFTMIWGPLVSQDAWIGVEWTPDFSPVLSDAVQTITITGMPTGGTFTLNYAGHTTDPPLMYNCYAAQIQAALEALPSIGAGNVSVVGHPFGPFNVTFQNALGGQPIPLLGATANFIETAPTGINVTTAITGGVGGSPPQNPVLFQVIPDNPTLDQHWLKIFYDAGAGTMVYELTNGSTAQGWSVPLVPPFRQNRALRIVAGWCYDTSTIYLCVTDDGGNVLGELEQEVTLPELMTFDGAVGFHDFRGTMTAVVIKVEDYHISCEDFLANPQVYVSPDPVRPDAAGNIPSTSLDNAIYAASFMTQENGTGGGHSSRFDAKSWTPIWVNYTTYKGKLFFPQQINCKYIKLEFTGLTEEPYPVYDSGIQTDYEVYPPSVAAAAPAPASSQNILSVSAGVNMGGTFNVNFLNPQTVNNAVNSLYGAVTSPILTALNTVGGQFGTGTLPSNVADNIANAITPELSTSWIFKRPVSNTVTIANQWNNVLNVGGGQLSSSIFEVLTGTIQGTMTSPLSLTLSAQMGANFKYTKAAIDPNCLPSQGSDWWVFPGCNLRLPASVMNALVKCGVMTARYDTVTGLQQRFPTTSVHSYNQASVTRDAAVAYFAGLREVQPFITTYIANQDPVAFIFSSYDPTQWSVSPFFADTTQLDSGPLSTSGADYRIINPQFDTDINNWHQIDGDWGFDPVPGHWYPGSATALADGTTHTLVSSYMDVKEGATFDAAVWCTWKGLVAPAGGQAIMLGAFYYYTDTPLAGEDQALPPRVPAKLMTTAYLQSSGYDGLSLADWAGMNDDTASSSWGQTATDWDTFTDGWIQADCGSIATVHHIVVGYDYLENLAPPSWGGAAFGPYFLQDAIVEYSTDGLDWTEVTTIPDYYSDPKGLTDGLLTIAINAEARYVRISADPERHYVALTQFQVWTMVPTDLARDLRGPTYAPWPTDTPISAGNDWMQIVASGFTVPVGANVMRLALVITNQASEGQVWFDTVTVRTADPVEAVIFKDFTTASTFCKLKCTFSDSGLLRSDAMWARIDPYDTHISRTALAYYTSTIPDVIPAGMWADTFAAWADPVISWGEPHAVVAISVDPDRVFQGKRVLHFNRAAGAGEAGVKVRQILNFVPNGLFRIGCVYYKPYANTNQVTVRLRRTSDGIYMIPDADVNGGITFDPVVGYWYEYQTGFYEIPDTGDQQYTVEFVCTGDDPDEMYLNDLYVEICAIRYYVRLGDSSQFLHDVTPLRHSDIALVSCTEPVNEFFVEIAVLSPRAWVYGAGFQPVYLK